MKSTTEVTNEIREMVESRVNSGVAIRVEWFTQEILTRKADISGEDCDFYIGCAVEFIKKTVKKCIGAYEPTEATVLNPQDPLPGFDYLQKAYTVERGGERMLVPVQDMTFEECELRAEQLDAMASGATKHAIELRGFARANADVA